MTHILDTYHLDLSLNTQFQTFTTHNLVCIFSVMPQRRSHKSRKRTFREYEALDNDNEFVDPSKKYADIIITDPKTLDEPVQIIQNEINKILD